MRSFPRPTINTGRSTKNVTLSKGTAIYSSDTTRINIVTQNCMIHKRALKFLPVLNSRGHFRFSNKQPLSTNVHFLKKTKYYTYIIMFPQKLVVWIEQITGLFDHVTVFIALACICCWPWVLLVLCHSIAFDFLILIQL